MKRIIRAASDYRTFAGYDIDEVQEIFPDIYYNKYILNNIESLNSS